MTTDNRPLAERLIAYRENLISIADQTEALAEMVEAKHDDEANTGPLRDGVRLWRIVADDLAKVLDGDELEAFIVEADL